MKKAEIIISVSKREGSTSEINCDMSRGMNFEPFDMIINSEGIPEIGGMVVQKTVPSYYETEKEEAINDAIAGNDAKIPF